MKGFFGMRILRCPTRHDRDSVLAGLAYLQTIEDALPIDRAKVARSDVPIGVFDALADFGQQRFGLAIAEIRPMTATCSGNTVAR